MALEEGRHSRNAPRVRASEGKGAPEGQELSHAAENSDRDGKAWGKKIQVEAVFESGAGDFHD